MSNPAQSFTRIPWPAWLALPALALLYLYGAPLQYTLLGIGGAIVANATGAGGGVIFIPVFSQLGLDAQQSVATSLAIQCFGMTTGALAWYRLHRRLRHPHWQVLPAIILRVAPASVLGLMLALPLPSPAGLDPLFGAFSVVLGASLLLLTLRYRAPHGHARLGRWEGHSLILLGLIGGAITAWLSVGVGELLVLLLILRRFDVTLAVACGVIVSAITVWPGALMMQASGAIQWQVVLLAGPGAILGGFLARRLATALPARGLKLFFAGWILLTGLVTLLLAAQGAL